MVLGGRGGSVVERVGEKAGVELLQVSGSSSVRGVREVRAVGDVRVHPVVARALKVFPQDLGALLLVDEPSSRVSEVRRAFEVVGHEAELLAGRRGRYRRVVRVGGRDGRGPVRLHEALMLEQSGQMRIGSQG